MLGMKTIDSPWRLRLSVPDFNGLEHWRRLCLEFNPQSPSQAAVMSRQLLALPECTPETLTDTMSRVEAAIIEHDKLAEVPMSQEIRQAIYEKICPSDWLTAMRLSGSDVSNASKLRARMALYIRGGREQAKLKSVGVSSNHMDIGGVTAPTETPAKVQSDAILGAIDEKMDRLAAMWAGKGGSWGGKDYSTSGKSKGKGKDSKGKGKGKGGKGKGKDSASYLREGTKICHKFAETGKCPHMEQYGWCKFKHVRNVPKSLSNIEGLRLEDLGSVKYNAKEDIYICPECDEKAISAQIAQEVDEINKELGEIEDFEVLEPGSFHAH